MPRYLLAEEPSSTIGSLIFRVLSGDAVSREVLADLLEERGRPFLAANVRQDFNNFGTILSLATLATVMG